MTTAVQRRRGTTTEHTTFTGLEGEISVNTTKETLVVHDGSTAGGFELARADGSNFIASSVDINGGTIDGTTIGASSASTGVFTSLSASGIDVTGTATMDGLTVEAASNALIRVSDSTNANQRLDLTHNAGIASVISGNNGYPGAIKLQAYNGTDTINRLNIAANGDISFYEDTGTTAKMVWDASAESLAIGGTAPSDANLFIGDAQGSSQALMFAGFGTDKDGAIKHSNGVISFLNGGNNTTVANLTERMRIDSSGNVLVGTTANPSGTVEGISAASTGVLSAAAAGTAPLVLYRHDSDGNILNFHKDGTTVGSIGTFTSDITIGKTGAGLRFEDSTQTIRPHNVSTNLPNNANVTLGSSDTRFKDLYLSGGVYLGGTGAANKLNDYEEGSFTPVIADAASGGNVASGYGNQAGFYTKVGRLVTCVFDLTNIATVGMTNANDIFIRDLPFTAASLAGAVQFTAPVIGGGTMTSALSLYAALQDNGSYVRLINSDQPAISNFLAVSNINSGATDLRFSITYFAA